MEKITIDLDSYRSKLDSLGQLIDELSKIDWDSASAVKFCTKKGVDSSFDSCNRSFHVQGFYDSLNSFDYKSLANKVEKCNSKCNELIKGNFNEYNEPYRLYINSTLSNTLNQLNIFFDSLKKANRLIEYFSCLVNGLQQLQNTLNTSINDLFEHFKYGNKNYVIFGKNGAGKTTLLKQISSDLFKEAVVIPANRNVNPPSDSHISYCVSYTLNKMLEDKSALFYLVRKISDRDLKSYRNGARVEDTLITKFYNIFSSLNLDREIEIDGEFLYMQGENIPKYSLSEVSDGEKSIVYILLATLLAPAHSFLFIDEPESHLNGALMRNLFDKLEAERPDLRFVYLTHNTDFVESRKNVELIYLEKTSIYKSWSFKKIDDYNNISLDVLLSIEGTKEDIIFCEGSRSSIDCKILECLYPEFEVMPVSSCEQVKLNTKGINGKETLLRRKAYGVIDNDYMLPDEVEALKKNRIFPIGFNEWENFLIKSDILDYVNSNLLNKDLSVIKNNVIDFIKTKGKQAILSDFITKRYSKMLYTAKLSYDGNLNEQLDYINCKNKNDLLKAVEELSNEIEQSIDYDKLVSIVPGKMLLNTVAMRVGLNEDNDYVDLVLKYLKTDYEFNQKIKCLLDISFT